MPRPRRSSTTGRILRNTAGKWASTCSPKKCYQYWTIQYDCNNNVWFDAVPGVKGCLATAVTSWVYTGANCIYEIYVDMGQACTVDLDCTTLPDTAAPFAPDIDLPPPCCCPCPGGLPSAIHVALGNQDCACPGNAYFGNTALHPVFAGACNYTGFVECTADTGFDTVHNRTMRLTWQSTGAACLWELQIQVGVEVIGVTPFTIYEGVLAGPSPLGVYTQTGGCATSCTLS